MRIASVCLELYLAKQLNLDALMLNLLAWGVCNPNLHTLFMFKT